MNHNSEFGGGVVYETSAIECSHCSYVAIVSRTDSRRTGSAWLLNTGVYHGARDTIGGQGRHSRPIVMVDHLPERIRAQE